MIDSASAVETADPATRFAYNLWVEPWIHVLTAQGVPECLGLRDCLVRADELSLLCDPSPLVVASLQRLLTAIAQDIFHPGSVADLKSLIDARAFSAAAIDAFGEQYAHRFDLFSAHEPFMQTSDIPRTLPKKKSDIKTVAYLFPEEPSATNINHFFHRYDDEYQYSPATAAAGLITISAFATTGGAGIKPSINGVPPLYVLPVGDTLFETIASSIIVPDFQPPIRASEDRPTWRRGTVVEKSGEVRSVGYLESLTFPSRRVRLFPEDTPGRCSRSGEFSDVLVRGMVFDMGLSRPKDAELWLDPFVAYRRRDKEKPPLPVRPQEGKAVWREYGSLFHTASTDELGAAVVQQTAELQMLRGNADDSYRFRCIGMRTDMKAKVFEWVDDSLDVPTQVLSDGSRQDDVQAAIERADHWNRRVTQLHSRTYGGDEFRSVRERMRANYWVLLAEPFRRFVQSAAGDSRAALHGWSERLFEIGEQVLGEAIDAAGDRGEALAKRAEALTQYRIARASQRKEWVS